ncbi:ABC transporter permease subunit [Jannaschia sp.]|nr:ABC transporter permease subunit [Jannaschia sp.]
MSSHGPSAAETRIVDDRDVSVAAFAQQSAPYYAQEFELIQKNARPITSVNKWALTIPWIWSAHRGLWLMFWVSLALDMLAFVCLLQLVKYGPLLAEAQLNPDANTLLISRYGRWMTVFGWVGAIVFVGGRLWMGHVANSWYYRQYARWRTNKAVASGVDRSRVVVAGLIVALIAPLTLYRSTQQRLDERACFNQVRAAEGATMLLAQYGASSATELLPLLQAQFDTLTARGEALAALDSPTDAQRAERSELRSQSRQAGRDIGTVEDYAALTARDSFDCWFIDDFPTVARLDPPEDVTYRRIPDPRTEGETILLREVKDPVEGRRVNVFTYSSETIDIGINYLRASYAGIFDAMTNVLRQSLIRVEVAFMQTPWLVVAFLFVALAWAFAGVGTTIFVASSLAFLAIFELWQIAMQTMALVVVSTALCVLVGLPVGIWMAKNKAARFITEPILDVMQTIPSLSYLVPAVAFFGISQPPAVLATVVFAMPPMIKLTALGIRQVPETTKEAALAFGASERQLLHKVELPMAVPSIMAGLNQTIMLALSMATISAFIGAEGLGAIVTSALGDAQAGKGLLAGLAIALVAMMIDRILKGIRETFSRI